MSHPSDTPLGYTQAILQDNLTAVRDRIARAAVRSGRNPQDIELVAVTKTVDVPTLEILRDLGQIRFGENRVDEIRRKVSSLSDGPDRVRFDLIGSLQTNKVRQVVGLVSLIHSVDSIRLLEAIHDRAVIAGITQDVLLQVNVSGEDSKRGIEPAELDSLLKRAGELVSSSGASSPSGSASLRAGVRVVGLMTIAPNLPAEQVRSVFSRLRSIRDEAAGTLPDGVQLAQLSMGMSNDFEVAIEEGATLVRVGSSLFRNAVE